MAKALEVNENSVEDQEPGRSPAPQRRNDPTPQCTQHENLRPSYLFTPVVGVSAGVCVAPDFGMTVSPMVVDGIFGL